MDQSRTRNSCEASEASGVPWIRRPTVLVKRASETSEVVLEKKDYNGKRPMIQQDGE